MSRSDGRTAIRCPECGHVAGQSAVLITYETRGRPRAFAACPACDHVYHPMKSTDDTERSTDAESTLFVCQRCGNGVVDPDDESDCPDCGGRLVDSSVPHD